MTIGAHRKLRAIIAGIPRALIQDLGNGTKQARIERCDMRICWSDKHTRVTVYKISTQRCIWHGGERFTDTDLLQASILEELAWIVSRMPQPELLFVGRTGRPVYL